MEKRQIKKWNEKTQKERKRAKINIFLFLFFILMFIFIGILTCSGPSQTDSNKKDENTTSKDTLPIVHNSDWDGSVKQVKDYLKENLNDADSYESVSWGPVQQNPDNHEFFVRHKYRAKNGFGALMLYDQFFTLDSTGIVINISNCE